MATYFVATFRYNTMKHNGIKVVKFNEKSRRDTENALDSLPPTVIEIRRVHAVNRESAIRKFRELVRDVQFSS
jgi:hypothetical protein